jgi:ESS family glutamate:Na+ symporter
MTDIKINSWAAVMISVVVLYLGREMNKRIPFLNRYNIPEPVSSGVMVSLTAALFFGLTGRTISFDLYFRDILLVVFFTTVGLSASVAELLKGGRPLVILLVLSVLLIFIQNGLGVGLAKTLGLDPNIGLLAGSISLTGGLGTSIAWGKILSTEYGTSHATEIGVACATIGLVMGGITGGPVAAYLIRKNKLEPSGEEHQHVPVAHGEEKPISEDSFLFTLFIIGIATALGTFLNEVLEAVNFRLPAYVTGLFSGIFLSNTVPFIWKKLDWPTRHASLDLISDLSLSLFLTLSLMSLQLWKLVSLAAPIMLMMGAQLLAVVLFILFVVFRSLRSNYEAAVICSGFAGFTLGATPNAIANMNAITSKYGPAPYAFIIVPLVGGFFIDLLNAVVIELFLIWNG